MREIEDDDSYLSAIDADDTIGLYLKEIGRVSLLNGPEEVTLAKRIEKGAKAAEELADLAASGGIDQLEFAARRALERNVTDGDRAKSELTQADPKLTCGSMSVMERNTPESFSPHCSESQEITSATRLSGAVSMLSSHAGSASAFPYTHAGAKWPGISIVKPATHAGP